jgi:aminopeptidase N
MKWLQTILLFLIFFIISNEISAQEILVSTATDNKSHTIRAQDVTLADSRLLLYDVKFYYIDIEASDTSTYLKGFSSINAFSLTAIPELVFELSNNMTIDSVSINGIANASYVHEHDLIIIDAGSLIGENEDFNARIYYHGTPGSNGFFSGVSNRIDNNWNWRVTYSLSEPFSARDWFACKQVLNDKIDSAYIFITTDTSLMAGSNGLLSAITPLSGGRHRFEWKTFYPIAYYLLSFTVADYRDYSIYAHPANYEDSILIQNFIYDTSAFLEVNRNDINVTADLIELYSRLFILYPFHKEKYGHCYAPMGGGMEHQTMTTLSSFNFALVAHELGHQWFGDLVTCASWQDIWINEGFASYIEYLALENIFSREEADKWMTSAHESARTKPDGSIYIPEQEVNDEMRIFSGALSYKKGASILHMIRYELDNDSVFFNVFRRYLELYKDSTATGIDFMNVLESVSGQDFDWFFDQWYFGKGYPDFSMTWWQEGDTLYIISSETGSSAETPFFRTHIDFMLRFADGSDSLIKLEQTESDHTYRIPVNSIISDVLPDPYNWLLDVITIVKRPLQDGIFTVRPNLITNEIWIEFSKSNIGHEVFITDMTGKVLSRFKTESAVLRIPVETIVRGVYLVTVIENGKSYSTRIVKK